MGRTPTGAPGSRRRRCLGEPSRGPEWASMDSTGGDAGAPTGHPLAVSGLEICVFQHKAFLFSHLHPICMCLFYFREDTHAAWCLLGVGVGGVEGTPDGESEDSTGHPSLGWASAPCPPSLLIRKKQDGPPPHCTLC